MDKEVVHISVGYSSAIEKKEIMQQKRFAATWTDLEMIILNKVSQRKKNTV